MKGIARCAALIATDFAVLALVAMVFALAAPAAALEASARHAAQAGAEPDTTAQIITEVRLIEVSTAGALDSLLSRPLYDVEIRLLPGEYHLTPKPGVDSTCGNCDNPNTKVPMTYGVEIRGERVSIVGPEDGSAVVYTHAGYGLYFNGCSDCAVERLSITGGARDTDGRATDAAIVVKNGSVRITGNRIFDNIGDSTLVTTNVVGIMGICGREESQLTIEENEILRNSWDGIALYRDASAFVERNTIDGVDKARGSQVGGGRGVGIGVTWNATADIRDNLVKRYWKGIGVFVDAWGYVRGNVVEDIITWGITYWDAEKGKPVGIFEDNVVYNTGACGVSIAAAETVGPELECRFVGNVLVKCAQDPKYDDPDYYCYQTALAVHAKPDGFAIEDNVFFDNRRATDDLPDHDVSEKEFLKKIRPVCERLSRAGPSKESDFVRDFCKGRGTR